MSGRLVSAVFASALPAWLKPYAAAYATFAKDDGSSIFPRVRTIARMVGRHERPTQAATGVLRELGVLEVTQPATPRAPNVYRLNVAALPHTPDDGQLTLWRDGPRGIARKKSRQISLFSTVSTGVDMLPTAPQGCCPQHPIRQVDPSIYSYRKKRA
jgi:hypothetical protein